MSQAPTVRMIRSYGGVVRVAKRTVPRRHVHLLVSGVVEVAPGLGGNLGVDVDGGDLAVRPDQVSEQGGVVAGARTDLQHAAPGVDIELVEHHGDDDRLGRAAERLTVWGTFDDHSPVVVRLGERGFLDEQVPPPPFALRTDTASQNMSTSTS
jgi:hypothetical protein